MLRACVGGILSPDEFHYSTPRPSVHDAGSTSPSGDQLLSQRWRQLLPTGSFPNRTDSTARSLGTSPLQVVFGVLHELREGARSLARNRPVRLVVGLFGSQAFVRGALSVLLVVVAIDVLDMGESGVGILTAAFGVGGILGATAGVSLVGRGRLGRPFQLALAGLLGLFIVVFVGFSHLDAVHNAAHDHRHSMVFPCH